ncbi:MAG TPA: FAD-dependent oxidoreductase [Accumulibacter sp.]|nr:FAD-dependent oxidoreductase [Accumulibacter sp.]HQC79220.1 FAD-dependent oxidoreductase [Accumulibacter sp.]
MSASKPMAVVVGSGLNALGIIRSLAVAEVPTLMLFADTDPTVHTRHARKQRIASTEGDVLIDALRSIAVRNPDKPVLFLTEEKSVSTVSERRDEIQPHFRIVLPEKRLLAALMHKQGFQDLANLHGSAVPPAVRLRGEADLPALATLRFPCVLKPAVKDYGYGAKFKKAYVVQSAAEAADLFREIAPVMSDLIVQEWIEGNDSDIYFCLQYIGRNGEVVASFSGRKIRSWPPRIGGTASCTSAPEFHRELQSMTAIFFQQVGFIGMGSMEYKRDPRDGRFYMVEPTVGRTDFQEEVATVNGTNIPLAAYYHELGQALPDASYRSPPRVWREPVTDRWSAQLQPEITQPAGTTVDAYWRLNDVMPGLSLFLERITSRLSR